MLGVGTGDIGSGACGGSRLLADTGVCGLDVGVWIVSATGLRRVALSGPRIIETSFSMTVRRGSTGGVARKALARELVGDAGPEYSVAMSRMCSMSSDDNERERAEERVKMETRCEDARSDDKGLPNGIGDTRGTGIEEIVARPFSSGVAE